MAQILHGSATTTVEEEAVIVAFRRHTLLPLDDCRRSTWRTPNRRLG